MSNDKLANPDKLGGGADFDEKKPGQWFRFLGNTRRDPVLPHAGAQWHRLGHRRLRRRFGCRTGCPGNRTARRRSGRRRDALLLDAVHRCRGLLHLLQARLHPRRVPPSYFEGDPYLLASSDQVQATHVSGDLVSGQTYTFRLQVIRATDTGGFLVAETDIASYTAP